MCALINTVLPTECYFLLFVFFYFDIPIAATCVQGQEYLKIYQGIHSFDHFW